LKQSFATLEGLFRQIKISAKGKIALDNSHGANLIGAVRDSKRLLVVPKQVNVFDGRLIV
jgi:hypothetical protein